MLDEYDVVNQILKVDANFFKEVVRTTRKEDSFETQWKRDLIKDFPACLVMHSGSAAAKATSFNITVNTRDNYIANCLDIYSLYVVQSNSNGQPLTLKQVIQHLNKCLLLWAPEPSRFMEYNSAKVLDKVLASLIVYKLNYEFITSLTLNDGAK